MGEKNDAILRYLEDNARFADLMNGAVFGGVQAVDPQQLENVSEHYTETEGKGRKLKYRGRTRDMIRRVRDGGSILRLVALEAQETVDYGMPLRCMNYDAQEYLRQARAIQRKNGKAGEYRNASERMGRLRSTDRLFPVYTVCLYHGIEPWDGPQYLSDMMRFEKEDAFRGLFRDYPMILIRADEPMDYGVFRTSLRELLAVLPFRKDRREMRRFIGEREAYRKLDRDTLEAIAVMTDNRKLLEKAEDYRNGKGEYDMYEEMGSFFMDGVEEGMEKGMEKGREEGREEGIRAMILDNLENGSSREQIGKKLEKYFGMSEEGASEYLEHFLQEEGCLSTI